MKHMRREISNFIFIALPKNPGAAECELHRTISFMSHINKILLRTINMRVRNKIKPEKAEKQCGFAEGKDAKKCNLYSSICD